MAGLPERLMLRNGTYYCRIWIPRDVAPIYGRQLVVTSLRTKDLKTAKSRLARKTVQLEDRFERLRSDSGHAEEENRISTDSLHQHFVACARDHAIAVSESEFEQRAKLFQRAIADPARLWNGSLMPLPTPVDFGHDEQDAYTYFDHLVAEGDLPRVLAFLARFRLRKRILALTAMRAAGDLGEFMELARKHAPERTNTKLVFLARVLLEEELAALEAIADGKPDPSLQQLRVMPALLPTEPKSAGAEPVPSAASPQSISLDELFARWEEETEPSASTLSSWRGIVRDLRTFLGQKSDDIGGVRNDDIVGWKNHLVRTGRSAATISKGYLACAKALFRFAAGNGLITSDPTAGVKLRRKLVKPGRKMLPYTSEEVSRLLKLASGAKEPWKRWLPWLAAATGSRIGEVAQLHGSHFFEEDGIPVVRISPAPDAGSIKNEESERTVPLHSALLAEGILAFVREKGAGPLFSRVRLEIRNENMPQKAYQIGWLHGSDRTGLRICARRETTP